MATTVNNAFADFLSATVRLDPDRTKTAKASRDWLIGEIRKFPDDGAFPPLHPDVYIGYGSFPRKTKIRPLDDIDLMFILHAQGATYQEGIGSIIVYNSGNSKFFSDLCNDGTIEINSIKLINRFKEYLAEIPQYKNADIKRNQEAVTLELQSYEWVYDIVPCFVTNVELDGRTYYIIPDGSGGWKKTDPRIDKKNVQDAQAQQEVAVVDVIRLIKYWNGRPVMPSMQSYLLENIVINYFKATMRGKWVDIEVINCLAYIAEAVLYQVTDPKSIQGDLNTLSWDQRNKIRERALADHKRATEARAFEQAEKMKEAIAKWSEVFGSAFPVYSSQLTNHA
jgi:hypothetical protein